MGLYDDDLAALEELGGEGFCLDVLHPAHGEATLLPLETLRRLMDHAAAHEGVARGVFLAHRLGTGSEPLPESLVWDNRDGAGALHEVPAVIAEEVAAIAATDDALSVGEITEAVGDAALEEIDERMSRALWDLRSALLDRLASLLEPSRDGGERDLAAIQGAVSRLDAAAQLAEIVETCDVDWSGMLECPYTLGPGELHDQAAYDRIATNACERQVLAPSPTIEEFYRDVLAPVPGEHGRRPEDDLDALAGIAVKAASSGERPATGSREAVSR